MQLIIANKNYSSWSMRPWVLLREFGIPFEEVMVRFDELGADSEFKRRVGAFSPAGRVPVLVEADGFAVWDSLAIVEALAEKFPQHALWPADGRRRARARSVCAEMHGGFGALRQHFPMNIEAQLHEAGARVLAQHAEVRRDLERLIALWQAALADSGGPFLFGGYSIADAFFAPVVMRLQTYGLPRPPAIQAWVERMVASPGVAAWIAGALAEKTYVADDEPYRSARD